MSTFTQVTHQDVAILATLPKASILVWLKIRIYAGKGKAYPTRSKMAEELDMSLPSINRAFRDLEKRCLIKKTSSHEVIKNNAYTVIKNDPLTIKNDQYDSSEMINGTDQKRSVDMIKNDQQNRTSNITNNITSNRGTNPDTKRQVNDVLSFCERAALAASPQSIDSTDEQDKWIGALWAKHSLEQGWRSNDIRKDMDMLKKGLSVIQVAKAVRKIDSYIVSNSCSGIYRGLSWARKMRDQWFANEKPEVSDYDRKKMSASDIMIGLADKPAKHDQAGKEEPIKKEGPRGTTRAHKVWSDFVAGHDTYEQQAEAVLKWRRNGGGDNELIEQAAQHQELAGFYALLTMPIVDFGGAQ